jgi:DHA1 family bicyclomycin/chloramphenicol resistance-like MFS transporter
MRTILLFCFIACRGFVLPNTTALAMAPHGDVAGSASAMLGTIQFVLGSMAAAIVSVLANGTAVPLAAVIAGCGIAAFITHHAAGIRSAASPSAGSAA